MLTRRVGGSSAAIQGRSMFQEAELLMEYPPPRTPNLPPTAGSASTDIAALPPLRFRSRPHPQRTSAGELVAYNSAARSRAPASMPATAAAPAIVHGSARSRSFSAPLVWLRRNASSVKPFANRYR